MKTFKVSKMFAAIIAGFLVLFAAGLMIFASNFAMSSYYDIPINPLIMALFSFLAIAVAVWLILKIFAYSKKSFAWFFAACLLTGIACETYGIYSDKISTGIFGIFGALLTITALVFGLISLYKSKNKVICAVIEAVTGAVGLFLTIGAFILLTKHGITKSAWILPVFPICILLIALTSTAKRLLSKSGRVLKAVTLLLAVVALISYSAAFSTALTCTYNYVTALKLPTALITSVYTDGDILFHCDFIGEKAYISADEVGDHASKLTHSYFSNKINFSEYPAEKEYYFQNRG